MQASDSRVSKTIDYFNYLNNTLIKHGITQNEAVKIILESARLLSTGPGGELLASKELLPGSQLTINDSNRNFNCHYDLAYFNSQGEKKRIEVKTSEISYPNSGQKSKRWVWASPRGHKDTKDKNNNKYDYLLLIAYTDKLEMAELKRLSNAINKVNNINLIDINDIENYILFVFKWDDVEKIYNPSKRRIRTLQLNASPTKYRKNKSELIIANHCRNKDELINMIGFDEEKTKEMFLS